MNASWGRWTYLACFAAGLVVAFLAWLVCRALGAPEVSVTVDLVVGVIAAAFAFSLFTGINLGVITPIRNVMGDGGTLTSGRGGLCLVTFAVALVFFGPLITALLT